VSDGVVTLIRWRRSNTSIIGRQKCTAVVVHTYIRKRVMQKYFGHYFTVTDQRNDRENRKVLSLDLNVNKVRNDVTSGSRLFYVLAAATANARPPMTQRIVDGTASAEVDNERRRCRPQRSVQAAECRSNRTAQVHEGCKFMVGVDYNSAASLYDIRSGARSQCRRQSSDCHETLG